MTPYEEEQERLRKIAAKVKAQDIWSQVYSKVYVEALDKHLPHNAAGIALDIANDAVQAFEKHIKP